MCESGAISLGDMINVCVPTGNFGNIFACYIAKLMGLPVCKLVCASNVNNVLTDFLRTGVYDRNRDFHTTISPSMDILISSNLERLLYVTLGSEKTAAYMEKLAKGGKYALSADELKMINASFLGYYTSEEETKKTIKNAYEKKNCLIDTHTAVAVNAAECYKSDYKAERKILVVSTASPYKFANDVYIALTGKAPSDELSALSELSSLSGVEIPYPLANLATKKAIHTGVIDKSEMDEDTLSFARN